MLRVRINQDLCVGAGLCVVSSGAVFDQRDEDGVVVLLQEFPPEGLHDAVRGAARKCPSLAITVEDVADATSAA
ncbi:ferredoxin [Sphingomonas sp. TF3]|uniref:ferredoxin n=1 Tax=Sphingomonas sp. TF3 TaxID=2495580 RepID=UPI000F88DCD8|nr:ferredoxin [Sphingomonas sp. TF3]RUN76523.1 ferredoxin [Sphingomonas sp. TF3]